MEVKYIHHCGDDLAVVNAARVSFNKKSNYVGESVYFDGRRINHLSIKDEKLINYLAKHKHYSPFNHCFITLYVKAPIFVARQLQKHEYMPWNEVSRRYIDSEPEFYSPTWRMKADNVKQGSGPEFGIMEQHHLNGGEDYNMMANNYYNWLLDEGVAPEQARMVLPQSMYTEWYWSGTLKAWAKMCTLRLDNHSQQETRSIAEMCSKEIKPLFPISWKALLESGLN